MTEVLVALDIGGTKTQLVVESVAGERLIDTVVPSTGWDAEPVEHGAAWIAERLEAQVPKAFSLAAIAFGAQGINRAETGRALQAALAKHGYEASAVNDAALIVPAVGLETGIGVIAGTGAVAVGVDAAGEPIAAGGWGWVIGDEGSAAGLVREATRAALRAADEGRPDDGLLTALLGTFGVADAERLARQVNDDPTVPNWAPHCPAVFAAADGGSALAQAVIDDGAAHLAALVSQLVGRGAVGSDVVVAGSVIVNQDRLFRAFEERVRQRHPAFSAHVLRRPPVEGALFLARRLLKHTRG